VALIHRQEILRRMGAADESALRIDPLLDPAQVGEVTVDLRLGCDFLVSILTRKPYISTLKSDPSFRGIASYFQTTRREFGDTFVLYPNQLALTTTLEYIGLPSDVYADILSRSSYTRLGLHLNTMIQPGFRGCFPIELFNESNNPVELMVGARVFQARLFATDFKSSYRTPGSARKYIGNVRPVASRAADDPDLALLARIREKRQN
jgi:dCTP deaminase